MIAVVALLAFLAVQDPAQLVGPLLEGSGGKPIELVILAGALWRVGSGLQSIRSEVATLRGVVAAAINGRRVADEFEDTDPIPKRRRKHGTHDNDTHAPDE